MNERPAFDLAELEAFVALARTGSFSRAAAQLGLAQSSFSQRIGRLETKLHKRLVERTTRSTALTNEGRDLLVYAEAMSGLAESVRQHFERPPREGMLKLGIVEDYVVGDLHRILAIFRRQHPRFAITLRTGLSTGLFDAMDCGELDIVLAKQKPGRSRGRHLFTERLLWAGDPAILASDDSVIPLALFPEPSATRTAILDTLRDARRTWTILTESMSLSGVVAAVAAGFAVSAFSKHFMPSGINALPVEAGLPSLPSLDYVIDQRAMPRDPAIDAFVEILSATMERSGTNEEEAPTAPKSAKTS